MATIHYCDKCKKELTRKNGNWITIEGHLTRYTTSGSNYRNISIEFCIECFQKLELGIIV